MCCEPPALAAAQPFFLGLAWELVSLCCLGIVNREKLMGFHCTCFDLLESEWYYKNVSFAFLVLCNFLRSSSTFGSLCDPSGVWSQGLPFLFSFLCFCFLFRVGWEPRWGGPSWSWGVLLGDSEEAILSFFSIYKNRVLRDGWMGTAAAPPQPRP